MAEKEENGAYKDISAEEMAAYFQRALNSETMKKIINGAPSISKAEASYRQATKMLLGYVSAAGISAARAGRIFGTSRQYAGGGKAKGADGRAAACRFLHDGRSAKVGYCIY